MQIQKDYLKKSRQQFEEAKQVLVQTNKRIDNDRKVFEQKKSMMDLEGPSQTHNLGGGASGNDEMT